MDSQATLTLNTGARIPVIGFGTWQAPPHEVGKAVEFALRCGYRHIDCAAVYRNEKEVGIGIAQSGVKRKDLFITSKLWNTYHDPKDVEAGLDKTLKDLGTHYLDLHLIHWPVDFPAGDKYFPLDPETGIFRLTETSLTATYKAMEALFKAGKVKAIGVSNFNIRRLKIILSKCTIIPAVNQVEKHPYLQQPELATFCKSKGILLVGYSPMGNNQTGELRTVDDPIVQDVAKELSLDPGQLLVSWGVQKGHVVLAKSVTESRIESNFKDVMLPKWAMEELDGLEKEKRFNFPARWVDIFDEVGEETVKRAAQDAGDENKTMFVV